MLASLVRDHRVIICVGSGGVGKTTTSASIALWGALQGRRAVVLTIDPARRLADSLGVGALGDQPTPHPVDPAVFTRYGLDARGSLAAMMLDQKNAWDRLVARHAPSDEVRERILHNRFYLNLSQSFAGSYEYMAIEQLCVLVEGGVYDLIVLDTPPTKHALDFFEAPERIRDFLDRRMVRWLVLPYLSQGWAAAKAMNRTVGFLFRRLEEATGISALTEISDFFSAMSGMFDAFSSRTQTIHDILRAASTAFVLVTGPEEQVLTEAEFFSQKMRALQMPLKGVVFNRVHAEFPADATLVPAETVTREDEPVVAAQLAGAGVPAAHVPWLTSNFVDYQLLARGEALRMEQFRRGLPRRAPFVTVPNFDSDLHDLTGLTRMHRYLFGGKRERRGVERPGNHPRPRGMEWRCAQRPREPHHRARVARAVRARPAVVGARRATDGAAGAAIEGPADAARFEPRVTFVRLGVTKRLPECRSNWYRTSRYTRRDGRPRRP